MNRLLVRLAFAGVLVTVSSGASVAGQERPVSTAAARPVPLVDYTDKTREPWVVDVDDQLSHEERALIIFLSLKADAERGAPLNPRWHTIAGSRGL